MTDIFELADALGPPKTIHIHEPSIGLQGILVIDNIAIGPCGGAAPRRRQEPRFRIFAVETLWLQGSIMSEQKEDDAPALHSELVALRKRIEVLEARVTELEEELRETQEVAATD